MNRRLSAASLTAVVAALSLSGMPGAEAKQHCSATMPSSTNGKWWSYRIIDGRKCWYEGKPGLSKALLEWPGSTSAEPLSDDAAPAARKDVANTVAGKRGGPLNAQAWAPKQAVPPWAPEESVQAHAPNYIPDTFEALWKGRIWLLNR
jgi:hypothetical protein